MKTASMHDLYQERERLGKDEIILDVRGPDEFAAGHIRGSLNIPHDEVLNHLDKLKEYKKVFIHCRSGKRAQVAVSALERAGLDNLVCVADGGFIDWESAGYAIER